MLRVRTGPECPEDNRRELLSVTNLNCGIAKEREKINWPEHIAAVSRTKGPSKSREELAGYGPAQPRGRLEAWGRGKRQARPQGPQPLPTANRPPVSNQRPPEILDGRHPPGGSPRDTGRRHPTGAGRD